MDILIKAGQLILSLSILVVLHEFGHFFFAKLFKTRVEKFYLFFDPWFSLFKFKKGDTEYGVGWLPLGGYVKISGMIDESMDKEAMKEAPKDYEFRSKPAYQRLLIMIGGVLVNFLLAFFIFWMILFTWGKSHIDVNDAPFGLDYHPMAKEIGLQDGDIITSVDTHKVVTTRDITSLLILEDAKQLTVNRGGNTLVLDVPEDFAKRIIGEEVKSLVELRLPFVVDSVLRDGTARLAGIQKGDSIIQIDGKQASYYREAIEVLQENKGNSVGITVMRDTSLVTLSCAVTEEGKIGIGPKQSGYFKITHIKYGFWEALPAGINKGVNTLVGYVKQLRLVFSKEGVSQLGGFGAIGNLFPATWDWYSFWSLTGFLSIVLAFMNILPIPALDGGHVLFLLYEIITGRKPSDKFLEYAQSVGMILLLALLLFANGNDIFKAIFK